MRANNHALQILDKRVLKMMKVGVGVEIKNEPGAAGIDSTWQINRVEGKYSKEARRFIRPVK